VAEVGLQRPGIMTLVRQRETADVPQHVRVDLDLESCLCAGGEHLDDVLEPAEGCMPVNAESRHGSIAPVAYRDHSTNNRKVIGTTMPSPTAMMVVRSLIPLG
jgi:hypothetical protein